VGEGLLGRARKPSELRRAGKSYQEGRNRQEPTLVVFPPRLGLGIVALGTVAGLSRGGGVRGVPPGRTGKALAAQSRGAAPRNGLQGLQGAGQQPPALLLALNRTRRDWHSDAHADRSRVVRPLQRSARSCCAENYDSRDSLCRASPHAGRITSCPVWIPVGLTSAAPVRCRADAERSGQRTFLFTL